MAEVKNRSVGKGKEYIYDSKSDLNSRLADRVVSDLEQAIAARGKASLVVSGGGTPAALFAELNTRQLAWDKVWVTLADERWVPATHEDSNERLVREKLLQNEAAAANFVGMYTGEATPAEGEVACDSQLQQIPEPFDVLILGMGGDGHTASLFPGADELEKGLDMDSGRRVLSVIPKHAPHGRMSYTLPALLNNKNAILLITGDSKWDVYQEASASGTHDAMREMPIRCFLHNNEVALDVYWAA
tara:strand:+ start:2390 stop:3124 length:735 start_codon:yes stop_codon:yes gene_type:complete